MQTGRRLRDGVYRSLSPVAFATMGVASLLFMAEANGQGQPPSAQQPSASPSSQAPALSDQKLGAAAAAMTKVVNIRQTYQQQLAQAPASDRDRIAAEANNAMTKAVTDQGLSVGEYNGILQAAQRDPTVRNRLMQHLPPQPSGQ